MYEADGFSVSTAEETQHQSEFVRVVDLITGSELWAVRPATIGSPTPPYPHNHFTPGVSSVNGLAIEWQNLAYDIGISNIDFSLSHLLTWKYAWLSAAAAGLIGVTIVFLLLRRRSASTPPKNT